MFEKNNYINNYIKENYKTVKIRIRYDDISVLNKINGVSNKNDYLLSLVRNDIKKKEKYNYINDDVKIDFVLSVTMADLVCRAEEADFADDYGLYMNLSMAIDSQAKNESAKHIITESEWNRLEQRYCL